MEILKSLENYLPITVISAVGLFALKEVGELFKRRAEKSRKVSAYKILIAEELQKNAWTIKHLKSLMHDIGDEPFKSLTFAKDVVGEYRIFVKRVDGDGGSTVLPVVHTAIFDKGVVEIASLDSSLFNVAKNAYEDLAEVRHIRNSVLTLAEDTVRAEFITGLPGYAMSKLDAAEASVNALFKACTGVDISKHKLRSFA